MKILTVLKRLLTRELTLQEFIFKLKGKSFKPKKEFNFISKANLKIPFTHILHTGENITGESHLDLWLPVFIASKVKFLVIIRNKELFEKMLQKDLPIEIVYAKTQKAIDKLFQVLDTVQVCFYPSNTGNNLHLLKYNEVVHVFIGHGDSDKTASAHKYFRVYDENWVAGEAHIDRFRNADFRFDGLKHVIVGRPNLRDILEISKENWKTRFNGKMRLLYLSTWEGVYKEQDYTSAYMMSDFFKVLDKYHFFDVLNIKLHPRIGTRSEKLANIHIKFKEILNQKNLDFKIHEKTMPVEGLIKQANIFICDISAVVSECLAANAPIFVYIPKDKEIKLSKSKMRYEYYTYTFSTIEELLSHFDRVILNQDDYLAKKREEAMEYILGKDETLKDIFHKRLIAFEGKK